MECKLVIFDLDGTILNTIDDLADSVNFICKKNGYPEHTVKEIQYMVGNGIPKLIERVLPEGTSTEIYNLILKEFTEYYKNHSQIKTRPYDGITELLKNLKKHGIKTAVNSNKLHEACIPLCNLYFPGLFDLVCGNKPENKIKPSPDGVNEILKATGVSIENTVYIGDSDVDVQTALNSGAEFIGAEWGFRGKQFLIEHGAKKIADTPDSISAILGIN